MVEIRHFCSLDSAWKMLHFFSPFIPASRLSERKHISPSFSVMIMTWRLMPLHVNPACGKHRSQTVQMNKRCGRNGTWKHHRITCPFDGQQRLRTLLRFGRLQRSVPSQFSIWRVRDGSQSPVTAWRKTQDASFQKSVRNLENQTGPNHEVFCVKVLPLSLWASHFSAFQIFSTWRCHPFVVSVKISVVLPSSLPSRISEAQLWHAPTWRLALHGLDKTDVFWKPFQTSQENWGPLKMFLCWK